MRNKEIDELLKAMEGHYTPGAIDTLRGYINELERKAAEWINEKEKNTKKVKKILDTMNF